MKHYVLGFAFVDRSVFLIKKIKPDWQRGLWNGLGGSIESMETSLDAMVREFYEESGVQTNQSDWEFILTVQGKLLGGRVEKWDLTLFSAKLDIVSYVPYTTDEGVTHLVSISQTIPKDMGDSALWMLLMCEDLHLYQGTIISGE